MSHVTDDMGMAELGEDLGLVIEAADGLGVMLAEDLDGDRLPRDLVMAAENGAHAPRAGDTLEDETTADHVSRLHGGEECRRRAG